MTDTQKTRAVFYAALVVFAVGVLVAMIATARAQDSERRDNRWATQRFCAHYNWLNECTRYRYERRRHYAQRQYREPAERVYSYQRRYDDENGQTCRDVRRAVGDQHVSVDGAKKAANEAWAAHVRFHHGEKFIDLANAKHAVYTCSRSSIKEAGTSVTTLGQQFNRCELEAVPCSPVRQREEER
jgi:hypothetical protein